MKPSRVPRVAAVADAVDAGKPVVAPTNDRADITRDRLREPIDALPVWNSGIRAAKAEPGT